MNSRKTNVKGNYLYNGFCSTATTAPWWSVAQDTMTVTMSQRRPFMVLVNGSFGGKAIFVAVVTVLHCFS